MTLGSSCMSACSACPVAISLAAISCMCDLHLVHMILMGCDAWQVLRESSVRVARWERDNKTLLSLINNTSLAFIIWQTLSSARDTIVNAKFGNMVVVILSTIIIHIIYLAFNAAAIVALQLPLPEAVTVLIMASQKSAPVAVTVILYITSDAATQGVLIVPSVVGQMAQIFIDQPLAHYLAGRLERWRAHQKAIASEAALTV